MNHSHYIQKKLRENSLQHPYESKTPKPKIKKLTSDSVGASCPKDSFKRLPIAPPFPAVFEQCYHQKQSTHSF